MHLLRPIVANEFAASMPDGELFRYRVACGPSLEGGTGNGRPLQTSMRQNDAMHPAGTMGFGCQPRA